MIDRLIDRIRELNNPTCVGLDTLFSYLPEDMRAGVSDPEGAAEKMLAFNRAVTEAVCDLVPAVKVQIACYEQYGLPGLRCFAETLRFCREKGLIVIADAKRNDIGSTAECYARAFLGETEINGRTFEAFPSDFVTVNAYLGSDGLKPFLKYCGRDKGLFALVKTSNPSSGELQDQTFSDGSTLYEKTAELLAGLGADCVGKYGFSELGAVVGATHPAQAAALRQKFPGLFFLIPGYGAQGGAARDLAVSFDGRGLGGIVNSSRGILCAYRQEKYAGLPFDRAARAAVLDMKADLNAAIRMA